jgi:signal transduction histidine kinase
MERQMSSFAEGIALDVGLAVAVAALELSDAFVFNTGQHRDVLTTCLLLASALPLVAWRRCPFLVLQVTGWATIALSALGAAHLGLGPLAATYAVASWSGKPARWAAAGSLLIAVWLVPLLTADSGAIPTNAALYAAAWILGALMRDRRISNAALRARTIELAREREEKAALAAESERARIARELHDVLTHSVSVMVIQAQAAQAAGPDHDRMSTALRRIEAIGQEALAELRGLLRTMRPDDEPSARTPQPGLDRLDELLETVRAAGVRVSLAREGTVRAVPASVQLSAYRIVQEALTNTIRHTNGASASVVLRYLPDALAVEVRDDGPATPAHADGEGRGLAGMRERARLVGGTLIAERSPEGGFRVAARLPLRNEALAAPGEPPP